MAHTGGFSAVGKRFDYRSDYRLADFKYSTQPSAGAGTKEGEGETQGVGLRQMPIKIDPDTGIKRIRNHPVRINLQWSGDACRACGEGNLAANQSGRWGFLGQRE